MTKLYSRTVALNTDIVDAFCVLQKGFTDQFVYYDKERPIRYLGLWPLHRFGNAGRSRRGKPGRRVCAGVLFVQPL